MSGAPFPEPLAPFPALGEAEALLEKYEEEPSHVRHVASLSDQLFVALLPWHRRGLPERQWLRLASLLHDIGWSQTPTGKGHHKESARLISEHPWKHLPPAEIALVAQIARYHRKKLPAPHHAPYQTLPPEARRTVDLLASILRIADALDRTHTGQVQSVAARIDTDRIVIESAAAPSSDWSAERRMAVEKKDLLELAAERPIEIEGA